MPTQSCSRPTNYHRQSVREGPWFLALRRLWERGWCDREISEALCDLSAMMIDWLERHDAWDRTEEKMEYELGQPWTARQVKYWRRQLELKGRRPRHDCASLGRIRTTETFKRAQKLGWGHLGSLTPSELTLIEDLAQKGEADRRTLEGRTGLVLQGRRHGGRSMKGVHARITQIKSRDGSITRVGRLVGKRIRSIRSPLRRLIERKIVVVVKLGYGGELPVYSLNPAIERRIIGNDLDALAGITRLIMNKA